MKDQEDPYQLDLNVVDVIIGLGGTFAVVEINETETVSSAIEMASSLPQVEYAEPNAILQIHIEMPHQINIVPNDIKFQSDQWNMPKVSAPAAWALQKGSTAMRVCIIDTGIDYNHVDLEANMASGSLKTGYNAITNQSDCMDDHGHGTHCTGVIGAVTNNEIGVAGLNWNIELVGCKFLGGDGKGSTADAIKCLNWCVLTANTKISSNSWGGGPYEQALYDAIKDAGDNYDHLFVASAGNSGQNIDTTPAYPASYKLPNVLAVGNTDSSDYLYYNSNFGPKTVQIAAPGTSIFSTDLSNGYSYKTGTSMACPHVAGAAALLKAQKGDLTYANVTKYLLDGADIVPSLSGKIGGSRRLNVYGALNIKYPLPTPSPKLLVASDVLTNPATSKNDCSYTCTQYPTTEFGGLRVINGGFNQTALCGKLLPFPALGEFFRQSFCMFLNQDSCSGIVRMYHLCTQAPKHYLLEVVNTDWILVKLSPVAVIFTVYARMMIQSMAVGFIGMIQVNHAQVIQKP